MFDVVRLESDVLSGEASCAFNESPTVFFRSGTWNELILGDLPLQ